MNRLLLILVAGAAVLWSLFAWGAYALVGWVGGLIAANADWVPAHPELVVWLSGAAGLITSLGLAGVVIVWAIGLAAILLAPLVLRLVLRHAGEMRGRDSWEDSRERRRSVRWRGEPRYGQHMDRLRAVLMRLR